MSAGTAACSASMTEQLSGTPWVHLAGNNSQQIKLWGFAVRGGLPITGSARTRRLPDSVADVTVYNSMLAEDQMDLEARC
ncbi:hypothetical protein [Glutamicibacter sp. BW77]|uniref:hypothetical protein n=2 Tax=unclassified Glutamicibacter TaxID=2627139 RepID=UPI0011445040|nr:hypothetical protein [Glutamicibacter sp. BW77]